MPFALTVRRGCQSWLLCWQPVPGVGRGVAGISAAQRACIEALVRRKEHRARLVAFLRHDGSAVDWPRLPPRQVFAEVARRVASGRLSLVPGGEAASAWAAWDAPAPEMSRLMPPSAAEAADAADAAEAPRTVLTVIYGGAQPQPLDGAVVLTGGPTAPQRRRLADGILDLDDEGGRRLCWQLEDLLAAARQGTLESWGE